MSRLEAVLFDHDGTLVDSELAHYQMWAQVLARHGVALTEDEYMQRHAGMPTPANAADFAARHRIDGGAAELTRAKMAATREFLSREAFPMRPGARAALERFAAMGLRLAVVTGAGRHGVESSLAAHGIRDCFETVVSGDDVSRSKPAPECYLLALEHLGLPAGATVAIEDTSHGAAAAMGAGIETLAVPTALSRDHDFTGTVGVFPGLEPAMHWVIARAAR